jgi:hypothetical protein
MKTLAPLAALMCLGLTAPAFAESHIDPMTLTCGDFAAMDMDGMMAATEAVEMAMMSEGMTEDEKTAMMAEMDAMTEEQMAEHAMKSEESMKMAMEHCAGMAEMTLMDAMKPAE